MDGKFNRFNAIQRITSFHNDFFLFECDMEAYTLNYPISLEYQSAVLAFSYRNRIDSQKDLKLLKICNGITRLPL